MGLFKKNDKETKKPVGENEARPEMMMVQLLFREKPEAASIEAIKAALEKRVGGLGEAPPSLNGKEDVIMLPVPKYKVIFKDKPEGMSPLASFMGPMEFSAEKIDEMKRSQFWNVKDGGEFIDSCKWQVGVHAMLSSGLHYKEQAELLLAQVGAALDCYPECRALYVHQTGKLTAAKDFREAEGENLASRFLRLFVNARFFRIQGTEDEMVVDTLGFYTFLGADVQVHFRGMKPDDVVKYVYNIAHYQFDCEFPINPGDTVDSLDENGKIQWEPQWKTQYENSLIAPARAVLDINCGQYAAGNRAEVFNGGKQ